MVWLHARSWRAHCHFVLNSTKREAIKKETAQTSYGGNGKKHPLVRLEARKIEGEHCALRKGSFEGQAMVRIYFFVGTYIFHASPEGRTGVSSYTGEGRHLGGIIEHIFFETGPKGRN